MAEVGGGRKRKAPLALDWDKLLPSGNCDDDEPPPLKVISEVETQKPQSPAIYDEEETSTRDLELSQMSNKELRDSITRMKRLDSTSAARLPDGGVKLRSRLMCHEAELKRRKLQKDDEKCKKTTPSVDEPTRIDAKDSMSSGTSSSAPASKSTFAKHFCRKLDDKIGLGETESFKEEMATLKHCDNKNASANGRYQFWNTQKIGLPSRQTPFKSPGYVSVKNDKPTQPNVKQLGTHSSTPSPHYSEGSVSCSNASKEDAPGFHPSHVSKRNSHKTVVLVDEEELETDVTDQLDQSIRDTKIYYPSRDDPEAIEICYSDIRCLTPESYLSSTIMNFYIRYLQKPSSTASERCDYHFFNTYFYEKLKRDVLSKADKETSFVKFRRWWKGVNIFEKAYIFLPIHESLHWSLVIICIPDKEDESGPIILHLDSLGMHASGNIFDDVKSFLIGEWKFLRQETVPPEIPIADKIWKKLSRRINEKVIEVPQQRNEYDCGVFVLFFMERFLDEAPDRLKKNNLAMFGRKWFKPQEASSLRQKILDLLKQEFKRAREEAKCKSDP